MKKFNKMLVPTDFSETSNRALEYAFTFASALDIELLVLHVVDGLTWRSMAYAFDPPNEDYYRNMSQEDMAAEVHKVLEEEKKKGITYDRTLRVTTLVREGVAADQIIKTAQKEKIDFIIMGARGSSAVADLVLGGVAEKVSRNAPCPVFLIRHRRTRKG